MHHEGHVGDKEELKVNNRRARLNKVIRPRKGGQMSQGRLLLLGDSTACHSLEELTRESSLPVCPWEQSGSVQINQSCSRCSSETLKIYDASEKREVQTSHWSKSDILSRLFSAINMRADALTSLQKAPWGRELAHGFSRIYFTLGTVES